MRCETCRQDKEYLNEADECEQCVTAQYFEDFRHLRAQYAAEKAAGLLKPREEYEADLRDAGRGHLIGG